MSKNIYTNKGDQRSPFVVFRKYKLKIYFYI